MILNISNFRRKYHYSWNINKTANSLTNDDIKLSERLFIPSRRLRGFESGKVGPKDGKDFIGGNFVTALNFNTNIPQLFPTAESFEFLFC